MIKKIEEVIFMMKKRRTKHTYQNNEPTIRKP